MIYTATDLSSDTSSGTSTTPTVLQVPAPVKSRFLIIGHGNDLAGDGAVGPQVAAEIESWHLPSIKTTATQQLSPDLIDDIVLADYVIFIDACTDQSCARTLQLDPIIVGTQLSRTLAPNSTGDSPLALLNLTQQRYGRTPQAWLLQVPTESSGLHDRLSATTERGYDRAVRTIEQFLKTYQRPGWMSTIAHPQSV